MATGFLITNFTGISKRINDIVKDHVLKRLYIQIYSKKIQSNAVNMHLVSKKITDIYSLASQNHPNLDVRIILNELKFKWKDEKNFMKNINYDVDVLILPKGYKSDAVTSLINSKSEKDISVILLEDSEDEEIKCDGSLMMYNNVVLGGTFDRLHAGHKILISQALLQCSNSLTVGVTDSNMIQSKILWELIEPCEKRIRMVQKFIDEVDHTICHNVVPISDMYGPTKVDRDLNMIVVSAETVKGAYKINEYRKENGMNELDICTINLVEDGLSTMEEESKISSSNIRKRLLGTRLLEPQVKANLPPRPYIIGLTGGICSGKSSIAEYLKTLGADVIDCDKVAHGLYKPGTNIYSEIVKKFGREILSENGEIDRKKLGAIVFNDSKMLDALNKMLWPSILKESLEQCRKLYSENKKDIIILEAAVLLRAGWHESVHEVWTTIIPRDEAIIRLKNRNNLTEEQAIARLQAQPSNSEQISIANVVFCTLWSYEYTRKQVQNAWNLVANC